MENTIRTMVYLESDGRYNFNAGVRDDTDRNLLLKGAKQEGAQFIFECNIRDDKVSEFLEYIKKCNSKEITFDQNQLEKLLN